MATFRIPIIGINTSVAAAFGHAYPNAISTQAPTNDIYESFVWVFEDDSLDIFVYGMFHVPSDYNDNANVVWVWTADATSGNVQWQFAYNTIGGNDTESLDPSAVDESDIFTDAAPSATFERMEVVRSLTDANFAANDTVLYRFSRNGVGPNDTLAANAVLVGLYFQYDDAS